MESKIKEIEDLLATWEAASKECNDPYDASYIDLRAEGLEAAIRILKEPSNTQMQTDKKPCPYNHEFLKDKGDFYCKHCGEAFYR